MEKAQAIEDSVGVGDEQRLAQEIERLRYLARQAKRAPGHRKHKTMAPLLVVLGLIAAGGLLWWAFSENAGEDVVQAFNGVERLLGTGAVPPTTPAPTDNAPADSKPSRSHRTAGKSSSSNMAASHVRPASHATFTAEPAPLALKSLAPVLLPPESPMTVTPPESDSSRVYSSSDLGVTPPVPLQPVLGRATNDGGGIPGDMEVLVGRNGNVEHVTLLAPNRYQDRMLIYAVKNRLFKPALVNGRPVRYLLRIRTGS